MKDQAKDRRKCERTFDPEGFKGEVRTWRTVRMKQTLDCKTLPPGFLQFRERFEDDVLEVMDFVQGISTKTCFCGKNPHSNDCLTWPHLTLKLLNQDEEEVHIHSFWLEPVELREEMKPKVVEIEGTDDTIERTHRITESFAGVMEVMSKNSTTIVKNPEIIFAQPTEKLVKENYVWISVTENASMSIIDLDEILNPNFLFDEESQEWMFNDLAGKVGEIVPKNGKNSLKGFEVVIKGEKESLLLVMNFFAEILKSSLKKTMIERIDKL